MFVEKNLVNFVQFVKIRAIRGQQSEKVCADY